MMDSTATEYGRWQDLPMVLTVEELSRVLRIDPDNAPPSGGVGQRPWPKARTPVVL